MNLEGAPDVAHGLGGALGRERPLGDAVLGELGEPVGVDERALGAGRRDDEVAVPGRELLERVEELLALGAAGGAAARCSARAWDSSPVAALLGLRAGLGRAGLREPRRPARGRRRLEGGVEVDRARELEQDLAALRPASGSSRRSARSSRPPATRASASAARLGEPRARRGTP